ASPGAPSASVRAPLCDVPARRQDRRGTYRGSCRAASQRSDQILEWQAAIAVRALSQEPQETARTSRVPQCDPSPRLADRSAAPRLPHSLGVLMNRDCSAIAGCCNSGDFLTPRHHAIRKPGSPAPALGTLEPPTPAADSVKQSRTQKYL